MGGNSGSSHVILAGQPPPAKRMRFDGDLIKVLVGSGEKCFMVHKPVVISASRFFRAAIDGGFKESTKRIVRLPEATAETFNNYVQWAYQGKIIVVDDEELQDAISPRQLRYRRLAELYILADTLDDMRLRNGITDEFQALHKKHLALPGQEVISLVYENVSSTATLRKLIVDYWASNLNTGKSMWLDLNKNDLPSEFGFDIAVRLISGEAQIEPVHKPLCTYHEHNDRTPACKPQECDAVPRKQTAS